MTNHRLNPVLDCIERSLASRLTVAEMARCAGMSVFHFSREFKRMTGLPPYRYLKVRRLESAKLLLVTTQMEIGDIAYRVGFQTPSHFSAEFRKATSVNPAEWRRLNPDFPQESDNARRWRPLNLESD